MIENHHVRLERLHVCTHFLGLAAAYEIFGIGRLARAVLLCDVFRPHKQNKILNLLDIFPGFARLEIVKHQDFSFAAEGTFNYMHILL